MLLKGVILYFKSTYCMLSTYKGSHFGIYMLPFCGVPSMFGLRTRDHLQWVQIASDERHRGLTSISDEHPTSFNLDRVQVSYHIRRMRQGPLELHFGCSECSSQLLIRSRGFDGHHMGFGTKISLASVRWALDVSQMCFRCL